MHAFECLKKKLICASIIVSRNWSLSIHIMCDESDYIIGVVLGKKIDGNMHVIYYASKTLNDSQ